MIHKLSQSATSDWRAISGWVIIYSFFFVSISSPGCHGTSVRTEEELSLLHKKMAQYSGNVIPNGGSVTVYVQLYVRDIYVRESPQDGMPHFGAICTYRERWSDPRLAFSKLDLDQESLTIPVDDDFFGSHIWSPDTFFSNEASGQPLERTKWDRMQRVYRNGTVLVSVRFNHNFACKFDQTAYPYGVHKCAIRMESYGQTVENVKFNWYAHSPLKVSRKASIPGYELVDFAAAEAHTVEVSTGTYSFVQANFLLKKKHARREMAELYVIPAGYILASWIAFVVPDWEKIGLIIIAAMLGLYNVAMPNILENHPMAKESYAHTWLIGTSQFLQAELFVLLALTLVTQYFNHKWNANTRRQRPPSQAPTDDVDEMQLVYLPPRGNDDRILKIARFAVLGLFIFAFIVWSIVASSKLTPNDPGWPLEGPVEG